ncbi:MAG: hypothetical protein VB099_19485 [Candidatus Limiplasma sp.]|nr:hypothetical protein [Candidatus Limiplasma sp.]
MDFTRLSTYSEVVMHLQLILHASTRKVKNWYAQEIFGGAQVWKGKISKNTLHRRLIVL